jgi:predicted enzyme related to lactoylglutathione lyase
MDPAAVNSVVHLELHTGDLEGAVAFYAQLLGWRPERIRAGAGSYLALGMGSGVGGGVVECASPLAVWLPYVEVSDVIRSTDRASCLGGKIVLSPREGPKGWRSVVSTPGGGEVAFWQPKGGRR